MSVQVERRLHARVPLPGVSARISVKDGGRRRRVSLVDLSLDGLCWQDVEPADRGTSISIVIRPRRLFGRALRLDAVIVRHGDTVTAAQFLAVQDRSRLEHYLQGKSHQLAPAARGEKSANDSVPFDAVAAFRLLGVGLDQCETGASRMVVVASARPADGKSFIAAGLAASLAGMGRRVLVVDADMHAPTQHLQFMAKGSPGLAQLLAEPTLARARELIQVTESGVALLSAGAAGIAPSQLMSRDSAAELAAVLRTLGYQLIIVDCPPILTSAETLIFSRIADDTVLAVRSGTTRERDVKQALDVLQRNGTPAAGVILNDYKDAVGGLRPASGASAAPLPTEIPAVVREAARLADPPAAVPARRLPV